MAETFTGTVDVQDTGATVVRITLTGDTGGLVAGGNGQDGSLILRDSAVNERVRVNSAGRITLRSAAGNDIITLQAGDGNVRVGGAGVDGDLALFHASATAAQLSGFDNAAIHLDADGGNIRAGGN